MNNKTMRYYCKKHKKKYCITRTRTFIKKRPYTIWVTCVRFYKPVVKPSVTNHFVLIIHTYQFTVNQFQLMLIYHLSYSTYNRPPFKNYMDRHWFQIHAKCPIPWTFSFDVDGALCVTECGLILMVFDAGCSIGIVNIAVRAICKR